MGTTSHVFCQSYPRTMNPCDFDKARTILIDHGADTVATTAIVRAVIRRLEHLYNTGDGPPPGEQFAHSPEHGYASEPCAGPVSIDALGRSSFRP